MTKKISTRIMRVGLEEVVGNHQPPQLTDRILQALADSPGPLDARTQAILDAARADVDSKPSRIVHLAPQTPLGKPTRIGRHRDYRKWTGVMAALSAVVLTVVSLMVLLVIRDSLRSPESASIPDPPLTPEHSIDATAEPAASQLPAPQLVDNSIRSRPENVTEHPSIAPTEQPTEPTIAETNQPSRDGPDWQDRATPSAAIVAARLRSQFSDQWTLVGVTPAAEIDDLAFADRLYKVLLGRSPDPYEWARLEANLPLSRSQLVDQLLTREKEREHFADHWADRLSSYLIDNTGLRNEALISPEAFSSYLQQRLLADEGLDQIVQSLLTAKGSVTPNSEDFNPATSFLVSLNDGKGIHATDTALNLFWGVNGQCARCHDFNGVGAVSQESYWRINSHFRQLSMQGNQESGVRLVDQDFLGELQDPSNAAVFFENDEKRLVAAFPLFHEGEFPHSGKVDEFDRRPALARALVSDIRFSRSMVNWVWSEVFGYPLATGDPLANAQSRAAHEMLDELALDFAAADFRLERLLEWIVLSPPMELEATPTRTLAADAPWYGQPALFSYWYPSRSRFDSIDEGLAVMDRAHSEGPQAIIALRSELPPGTAVTGSSDAEAQADVGPQTGINWRLVRNGWFVSDEKAELLHRIVVSPLTEEQKIEHIFLLGTGQPPSNAQMRQVKKWLNADAGNPIGVYQDVWWTLQRVR